MRVIFLLAGVATRFVGAGGAPWGVAVTSVDAALSPTPTALSAPLVPLSTRDWHISPLVRLARGEPPFDLEKEGYPKSVKAYALGFASTILAADTRQPAGVLVAVFDWSRIQNVLDLVERRYQDADDPRKDEPRYPSGYPFLFASDLDTIIGHAHKQNLGTSLSGTHGLAAFRERMRGSPYGSYSYEYPKGTKKISGFAETATPSREGFGWVVGVGINSDEIFADVTSLRDALLVWALIVTGLVILAAALFSHRITEPLTRLMGYTGELARGNLDARVDIRTNDEIAVLADSFNRMAEDLKESSARLIKAEKELAWKEMARQVAHEIKNPLTPIVLSAQQLARAHKDRHRDFDEILAASVATIIDQCEALRRIAANFAAYATFPKRNVQPEEISTLVRAAVDAYRPRLEGSTEVVLDDTLPRGLRVLADKDEMRRVFLNLFNNAIEAMEGRPGRLSVRLARVSEGELRIDVSDTGRGIPDDVRGRLFQPYFSTRTGGTGLGLAICRNIILEHQGTIDFTSQAGAGTTFTIVLPVHRDPPPAPHAA